MRAAWYDQPGPARTVLQVGELPDPTTQPGEVLVKIKSSGINPSDYKRRGAASSGVGDSRMVPHSDGAGIVVAAGDGVDAAWVGRRVWAWNAAYRNGYATPEPRELGTAAEYVALPLDYVSELPSGTPFAAGACLGVPAFTAYSAVLAEGPVADTTILVQGGAGSVGELAVQLARAAGARVIATVSSEHKARRARDAGANEVINYRQDDVVSAVRDLAPAGVDRIVEVDFAANIYVDADVIKPYGTIASYSSTSAPEPRIPYYPLQFKAVSVRTIQVFSMPVELRAAAVDGINRGLLRGELRPTIAQSFPLEQIAQAHEAAEAGPDGNVVLNLT